MHSSSNTRSTVLNTSFLEKCVKEAVMVKESIVSHDTHFCSSTWQQMPRRWQQCSIFVAFKKRELLL